MPAADTVAIPFPLSSFPGFDPQESMGRLFNAHVEPLGENNSGAFKWVRSAGLSLHAATAHSGYRGGLIVGALSYECWSNIASTVDSNGVVSDIGAFPGTRSISIARNQAAPTPDIVAVDTDNGAYVLGSANVLAATATATIGGTTFVSGDKVSLTVLNPAVDDFPISVTYTLGAGETATTIATGLKNLINANATLSGDHFTAASAGPIVTFSHQGGIGNQTTVVGGVTTTTGNETITFAPTSGNLSGGQGTFGAFVGGVPTLFNGNGVLPEPNSVCFQDGYFFFTVADGEIYATGINSLSMNALTRIVVQAKADVTLLRGIAFSGVLLAFTTGSCEVWQDAANPAPDFPYARVAVLEFGLAQSAAIAGWETGFSELLWVAQDFGVHWMTSGGLTAVKVSPSDLDRLIEAAVVSGDTLKAGCYISGGKKFWTISSSSWTWEFNLQTKKWDERGSLSGGVFGRWRAVGGHPAFGKWLTGDQLSGNLVFVDDTNPTDAGGVHLWRLESGLIKKFPAQQRVARADFNFVVGVGQAVGSVSTTVTGAAAGTGGVVRLAVVSTSRMSTGDIGSVANVVGTTEANGSWPITVIDSTHIELQGSTFTNAYTSGGSVTDLTSPPNAVSPSVAISWSKDGGVTWSNPLVRDLGEQKQALRTVVSITNLGIAGPMGIRFRVDISDPIYASLLGATASSILQTFGS